MALIMAIIVFGLLVHVGWREIKRKFRTFAKEVLSEDEEDVIVRRHRQGRANVIEHEAPSIQPNTISLTEEELARIITEASDKAVAKALEARERNRQQ